MATDTQGQQSVDTPVTSTSDSDNPSLAPLSADDLISNQYTYASLQSSGLSASAANTGAPLATPAFSTEPPQPPAPPIPVAASELEMLAIVLASEVGSQPQATQIAVAWAVRQRAAARNTTIFAMESPRGPQVGSKPPFSSDQDATDATRAIALQVLAQPLSASPYPNATAIFEPGLQDLFVQAGIAYHQGIMSLPAANGLPAISDTSRFTKYKKTLAQIRANWGRTQYVVAVVGTQELWGEKRTQTSASLYSQTAAALQGTPTSVGRYIIYADALTDIGAIRRASAMQGQTLADHRQRQAAYHASMVTLNQTKTARNYQASAAFQAVQPQVQNAMTFNFETGKWSDGKAL